MTTQITIEDYWMGRDKTFACDLTDAICANAQDTVSKVNLLLFHAAKNSVIMVASNKRSLVNSGWRPPAINAAQPNASAKSLHMTGLACDISDPNGALGRWCYANLAELEAIGLWMESKTYTPGWVHLQTIPPRSGKRIFQP